MTKSRAFRLGTRGSALARWQAEWVAQQLQSLNFAVELVPITTRGDSSADQSIVNLGSPGVFTKELQRALLDGTIDLAVHSLKDLPTDPVDGLVLAAVPPRETAHDVLLSRGGVSLDQLEPGASVGTGSLRRQAQLLHLCPDVQVRPIRGNVDTRIAKLDAGEYDAIVLAQAGLRRLGLEQRIAQIMSFEVMLPAVGQGALGIEVRVDDSATRAAVISLDHLPSHAAVRAERTLLTALGGGCLAPVGAWAWSEGETLHLDAVVLSADGRRRARHAGHRQAAEAELLGAEVAQRLLADGVADWINQSRQAS